VVRNMNEWYDAFDITSGTLWLKPSERMKIW
jgi:predicted metalloendopeptidase